MIQRGFAVRTKGLEPPRRETLDPKSSAATNYATCAFAVTKLDKKNDECKSSIIFFQLSLIFLVQK